MGNLFIKLLIVFFAVSGCKDSKGKPPILNESYFNKAFVPNNIKWQQLDSTLPNYGGLYSNFKTFYITSDSLIYLFESSNNRKLNCIDTSIYDKANDVYNDTSICHFEDSILFGVENVEMFKGRYCAKGDSLLFEMRRVINDSSQIVINTLRNKNNKITGVLRLAQINKQINFFFNGQTFIEAADFKNESNRRLLEYIKIE